MQAKELCEILQELTGLAEHVNQADVDKLIAEIEGANKLFLAGAGRSGFMIRAFANRLMHLGYETYLVGETITPPAKEGDLLIIGSGSGETGSLVSMAQKAVVQKAKIALISIYDDSSIGKLASAVIKLPGSTRKSGEGKGIPTIQPLGSSFEQLLFLTCDSIVLTIMRRKGIEYEDMFARHANLE